MRRLIPILLALVAFACVTPAYAQFNFGSGGTINVVGAALPPCTATMVTHYVIVDPTSATDIAGGNPQLFDQANHVYCDQDDLVWRVLASTYWVTTPHPVSSVHGRTGAVVSQPGDYDVSEVTNAAALSTLAGTSAAQGASLIGIRDVAGNFSATTVEAALAELITLISSGTGATNLGTTTAPTTVTVTSDTGADATLPAATGSAAGVMTAADRTKLDGISAGATVGIGSDGSNCPDGQYAKGVDANGNAQGCAVDMTGGSGSTNLSQGTRTATTVEVLSSSGTAATLSGASTTQAGVMAAADKAKVDANDVYYAEAFAGADLFAQVNAAKAQAIADGARGAVIELPRGSFTVTGAKADLCDERGNEFNYGFVLRGQGAGILSRGGTRIVAGAGFASTNVSRTNYTVTAGGGDGGRDIIECVGCDFRAAGITRGSLVETTGFAAAGNNYSRAVGKMPLKVYRAEATRLTVEDERTINATLVNVSATTTGHVRLLKPMIEVCGNNSWVTDVELDADEIADMLVHHRPDNAPSVECSAASAPYPSCTGAGTGSAQALITVNGGVDRIWGYDPIYFGVASTAPESSGQADHWGVRHSHFWGGVGSVWYDGLQAQPGFKVADSQLEAFKGFGFRLSSGSGILDDVTIISADADCRAGTYGTCAHVWMSYDNVVGLHLNGKVNIEMRAGKGIHVVDGGTVAASRRFLSLGDAWIQANDTTAPTNVSLLDAPNACLSVDLGNSVFNSNADPVNPATITIGNANQATCPSEVFGRTALYDTGPAGAAPVMTINNGIPSAVVSAPTTDNAIMRADGARGAIQGSTIAVDDAGNIDTPGQITTGDPGNNARRLALRTNTASIGTPDSGECNLGWVGTTLHKHCAGGSLASLEGSGGGGYATIDDEDAPLTQRSVLNFEGAGVTCADDTDQTTCTIPGGGSSNLDGLSDVVITTPATGATLIFDGTNWLDGALDLADTDARTGILPDANVADALTIAGGVISGSAVTLIGTPAPANTLEGSLLWDSDDDRLAIGDGAATRVFHPGPHTTSASDLTSGTLAIAQGGTGANDAATARTNLGVQAADADLDDLASDSLLSATRGGTGDDTSATTGVPRVTAGNWTYDAGVSHLAASTSAALAGVLSDETGSGGGFVRATAPTIDSPVITTKMNPPSVTAFPGSPSIGDVVIVTDDATAGACGSAGGSAVSWCRWNGSAWVAVGDGGSGGGGGWTDSGTVVEPTSATDDVGIGYDGSGTTSSDWAFYFDESTGELRINVPGGRLFVAPDAVLGGCIGVTEGTDDGGHTASFCLSDSGVLSADTEVASAFDSAGKWAAAALGDNSVGASQLDEAAVEAALEAVLDLPDLQGAVTDGQVPNTITIDGAAAVSIDETEIQLGATDRLVGRDSASGGPGEEITVGGGIEFTGSGGIQRSALTGDVAASAGSATTSIQTDTVGEPELDFIDGDTPADEECLTYESGGSNGTIEAQPCGGGAWDPLAQLDNLRDKPFFVTDLTGDYSSGTAGDAGEPGFGPFNYLVQGGSTAVVEDDSALDHPGIVSMVSGAAANSGGGFLSGAGAFRLGGGEVFEAILQIKPASGTNILLRAGFHDTNSSTSPVDGVWIQFDALTPQCHARSNGSSATPATISGTYSNNTWYRLRVTINSTSDVDCEIFDESGALIGSATQTTNIPSASGRNVGARLVVTENTTGTTAALAWVDWLAHVHTRALVR